MPPQPNATIGQEGLAAFEVQTGWFWIPAGVAFAMGAAVLSVVAGALALEVGCRSVDLDQFGSVGSRSIRICRIS